MNTVLHCRVRAREVGKDNNCIQAPGGGEQSVIGECSKLKGKRGKKKG